MNNIVRPFAHTDDSERWEELIEGLYAHCDQTASSLSLTPTARKPLKRADDMSIVADVIEALKDTEQARFARMAFRHALKEVAKATLAGSKRR